jgi:hypothetical protein
MRDSSDGNERLRDALAAIDGALFRASPSPKDKFDVDRGSGEPRVIDLEALNQRFRQLDEYYSRAVAEIKASLGK